VQPALNTFLSCRVAIVVKQLFKSQISHTLPRLLDSGWLFRQTPQPYLL